MTDPQRPGEAEYLRRVGLAIRLQRTGRGLSQDALAAQAQMSRVTLGSIERGDHSAGLLTYRRLADALAVPIGQLVAADSTTVTISAHGGSR